MPTITTKDGAEIFYKDWGTGEPVVFSHGWPLTADIWDNQLKLLSHGDDDQIVPIQASSERSIQLIPNATLTVHPGAPHGLTGRFEQDFNAELIAFIKQ